jgi:hypothetical protein
MNRERRTQRWRYKCELLAVGDGSQQIAPGIERGRWSDKEICTEEQSTPSPPLSHTTAQPSIVPYIAKNATLKSKTAKTYTF